MLFLHIFNNHVHIIISCFPKCTYPSGFTIKILPASLLFFMRPISSISIVIRGLIKIYFMQNGIYESNLYSITMVAIFRVLINVSLRFQVFLDVNLCFLGEWFPPSRKSYVSTQHFETPSHAVSHSRKPKTVSIRLINSTYNRFLPVANSNPCK